MKPVKYKGYVIRNGSSRATQSDFFVENSAGEVLHCGWSKADCKRWIDSQPLVLGS